jgi:hypothetical protein
VIPVWVTAFTSLAHAVDRAKALAAADVDIPQNCAFPSASLGHLDREHEEAVPGAKQASRSHHYWSGPSGFIEHTLSIVAQLRAASNQMQTAAGGQRKQRIPELLQIAAMAEFQMGHESSWTFVDWSDPGSGPLKFRAVNFSTLATSTVRAWSRSTCVAMPTLAMTVATAIAVTTIFT